MKTPKPITREDMYYSYIINGKGTLPKPITRKEMYLYYLCVNGFGSGGGGGTGDNGTPVGEIISYMGTAAPEHYLICDGTEYNVEEYPELAQHFIDNFGSASYFGGDGETTFAVPDLRGEFLRGTGTATRNTGSGTDVGVHQKPTIHKEMYTDLSSKKVQFAENVLCDTWNAAGSPDTRVSGKRYSVISDTAIGNYVTNDYNGYYGYTSRPTNTSVLYCIKCELI